MDAFVGKRKQQGFAISGDIEEIDGLAIVFGAAAERKGDVFAVRSPGKPLRRGPRPDEKELLGGAVGIGGEPAALVGFGIVATDVDHALAVGRESRLSVDIADEKLGSAAQNRSAE